MRHIAIPLVCALAFWPGRANAQTGKTDSLVLLSGIRPIERWSATDRVHLPDGDWYVAFGTLACILRSTALPVPAVLWSRGDLYFFHTADIPLSPAGHSWPADPKDLPALIQSLRSRGKLSRTLHLTISDVRQPVYVGYLIETPAGQLYKSSVDIFLAAQNAEPEHVPVSLELVPPEAGGVPSIFVSTLISTFVGAFIGLGTFYAQQRFQRNKDLLARFEERKIEKSAALWRFFQEVYGPLKTDPHRSDLERVTDIRKTMIEDAIYPTLLPQTAAEMASLCDGKRPQPNRVQDLDALLRKDYPEFIT